MTIFRQFAKAMAMIAVQAFVATVPAQALEFQISGSFATVSGTMDIPDIKRFRNAVNDGVKYFILRGVEGGELDFNYAVADEVAKLKTTMVIDGPCWGGCTPLLLAGAQRLYMKADNAGSPVVFVNSAVFTGDSFGAANITDVYVYMRARLTSAVSNALLRKHTNGYSENSALLFVPSDEGSVVLDCDDVENLRTSCQLVDGVTAHSAGVFTSEQAFSRSAAN